MEGGKAEAGNGFEFWRQLFLENEGSGALINAEGRNIFQEYPKCAKLPDLSRHLYGWTQLLDWYAPELYDNSKVFFTTMMSLIPDELEEEISLNHDDIDTFQEVMEFCKKRTNKLQAKTLASLKRKEDRSARNANSISDEWRRR